MKSVNEAKDLYKEAFGKARGVEGFFSHGRLELLGNHTDHNGGLCLVAAASLGITAAVKPNKDDCIRIASKGYRPFSFYLDELKLREGEEGTSIALTKGVLSIMKECGFNIGGFSAAMVSDIAAGSGVSSSAAFSILIAELENEYYNDGEIDSMTLSRIAKAAENEYFGKPSGMLDQIGSSFGGVNYLDFSGDLPTVEPVKWTLPIDLVLINTGSSHADLTPLYASIREDMACVARNMFRAERLCEASRDEFLKAVPHHYEAISENAKMRAQHFYDENERVKAARKALEEQDEISFLNCVRQGQLSQQIMLRNTMVPGVYERSPQQCVDLASKFIGKGAARAMGGGFGGSVLCFVYPDEKKAFMEAMASYYGAENVIPLTIPTSGPSRIEE